MERGKDRAELRTGDLRRLLGELETRRDGLMDEVAEKRGECEMIEKVIKRTYEIILDTNKDEQAHEENERRDREKQTIVAGRKEARAKNDKENAPRKVKVEKAMDGLKNSTRTKETQDRARAGRTAAAKKSAAKKKDK
jgi:hypothetical protein